ncbi:hypothetical protein K469DRAFT_272286 [Zopfia rhizophila CBS 207.26]|uniref:Uncharacterized protein n=1 Tax=Zopfia rhizophila CBS 207.26 TaxID=1314779 RepID=A0A6A6DQ48_9PEZI|nr:hypothetical protein K469DRAFT_272286 [Zopfia rhizophila CBS 207.26]
MHSFILLTLLTLTTSTLAFPLGKIFDVIFQRDVTATDDCGFLSCPPVPTGTGGLPIGTSVPFPTGTSIPTVTGSVSAIPQAVQTLNPRIVRKLSINYNLPPATTVPGGPGPSLAPEEYLELHKERRQQGTDTSLPSFSLLDPSDTPTLTGTGGLPTGTGTFPTGGDEPFFPTTFATLTRGPQPTATGDLGFGPELPELPGGGNWWEQIQEWLQTLGPIFGGKKNKNENEKRDNFMRWV